MIIVDVDTLVALVEFGAEGVVWILKVCWDAATTSDNDVTVASVLHKLDWFKNLALKKILLPPWSMKHD